MKSESLFGFIAGATLGALAGILFAPDKGEETRRKFMEAASEGYDEAKEELGELAHDASVRYRYARIEAKKLKKTLQECVDAENKKKPLTDEQLVEEMGRRGYKVARRTIAKYRGQLGIPLARWRKEL